MFYVSILGAECQESFDLNDQMFKPGWKDIFRMNENELESEIRKVYRDSTLDPRRKAYLVQNLLTRLIPVTLIILLYTIIRYSDHFIVLYPNVLKFQLLILNLYIVVAG